MEENKAEAGLDPAPASEGQAPAKAKERRRTLSPAVQGLLVPVLAVFTGLVIGAIVIAITDATVIAAYRGFLRAPGKALAATWHSVATAYGALFSGSLGSPREVYQAIRIYLGTGDQAPFLRAIWPITESLVAATPYIFGGLAVALGFRCGLFNIGAEGQVGIGALAAAFVGYRLIGVPAIIHLPLALLAGALGGAFWAAIPGYLKAKTGAHEVVNSIMMNWISFRLSDWLLTGPMKAPGYRPVTSSVEASATLPRLFPPPIRFNAGFFLALGVAALVYWLLFKTTLGFEIRTVGANPDAARYAGMSITRNFVLAMALSGALAGLAGTSQVLGVDPWVGQGFSAGYGFDSIAIALLGKSHPWGVVAAALLFGALRSGATRMQSLAGIPIDIISIIQGLVIM
ncbi:MAG: ABC transporter permease, partial [Chloroflexota bacterium]|nr:ABC transporter permease [Chloroflexota bacterium]